MIVCENGIIHWPTRELHPHTPRFYVHHSVPFAFDAKAREPKRWLAFLNQLWGSDVESISCLQEMFGYLLSGDTAQQKMFLIVGPKRGGKGTIARVITRLLGQHNVAGPTLSSLGTNFGLQDLIGKPVAVVSDARLGGKADGSLITERLLSISGQDLQNVDRKFLPPWSGQLPTRFVVMTNELPRLADSSGALASRFVVLMLDRSFYGRENPALTEELSMELPAIFNWALDGLARLRQRGYFHPPASSRDAIQALEDLGSPMGAFVRDRCGVGPDRSVEIKEMYANFRTWCEETGRHAVNQQVFGRDLRAVRPEVHIRQLGTDRHRHYVGIGLGHSRDSRVKEHCSAPAVDQPAPAIPQSINTRESREGGAASACAQCGADGAELLLSVGGQHVRLHPECRRFWIRSASGTGSSRLP
jgi:putative DNA primase/helicase